jgi:hypothetical protein
MANSTNKKAAAGLAAAAAAAGAAAAGYYFYASKDAKSNRKNAAKWARDMKDDVVKQAKKVQDIDRAQLLKIIDGAAATYETVRTIDRKDLTNAARELKNNWQLLSEEVVGRGKRMMAGAPKTAKKAVKKVKRAAKKAAPKRR